MPSSRPPRRAESGVAGRARRLEGIVTKAASLFQERGYDNTSVNDLASDLGISIGGLYRYIATKSDVLALVCEDIYGDLPDSLASIASESRPPGERLRSLLETYFDSCRSNRALILLMYREYRHLGPEAQARFKSREQSIADVFEGAIADGVRRGDFAPVDTWAMAHQIVLLGHFPALKGWAIRAAGRGAEDVAGAHAALILGALDPGIRTTRRRHR